MTTKIEGVVIRPLRQYSDARGWLMELFREDELPEGFDPAMAYISVTHPGISRGPHEHRFQTDGFCFFSGSYQLTLWENRPGQPKVREDHQVGESNPVFVTVPPGVVHAYTNSGPVDAFVMNLPNQLYAGRNRQEPIDEIRHEEIDSEFRI